MTRPVTRAPERDTFSARDLRRQDKIRQIVLAATEVFLDSGFAATSMDRIVEKAGVSKRTLYNYYKGKEELFIDVMQMQLGSLYENFEKDRSGSADPAEQLQRLGIELLRLANAPATLSLFRIAAAEAQRFPKFAQHFFEQSFENVIDSVAVILDHESEKLGMRVGDSRQAGEFFLDLLTGTAYLRVIFGTTAPWNDKAIKMRTSRAVSYFFETYSS
jgi:AcrR family transcriptional regulator